MFKAMGILMIIIVVGFFGIMLFRRKFSEPTTHNQSADTGFSLSSIREMRDRGEITNEEYQRARDKIIAKVKSNIAPPAESDDTPENTAEGKKPT